MREHNIDVKSYLREKNGLYYVSLVYVNAAGKRRDKSFPTKLPVKGNKKKAEAMARQIAKDFEIPAVDLYLQDLSKESDNIIAFDEVKTCVTLPPEVVAQVTLEDLTKAQVAGLLFADYLEKYLPIAKKRGIEDTTFSSYQGHIRNPIGPYFREQEITLGKLKAEDIQTFYDLQLERVCANTVIHYHAIIRLALCYARKKGYIKENPIEEVDKPVKNQFVGSFYTSAELNQLIELTRDTHLEFPVIFGGFYGLRRSEIVGLRWSAFDFENNVFYVNHTVTTPKVNGKTKIVAKDRAKTKSSLRALPLAIACRMRKVFGIALRHAHVHMARLVELLEGHVALAGDVFGGHIVDGLLREMFGMGGVRRARRTVRSGRWSLDTLVGICGGGGMLPDLLVHATP